MGKNLIVFNSVTYAIKSRELLKKNKINSTLVRTPVHIKKESKASCGYSLYVRSGIEKALEIIGSSGITVLGVYAVNYI